MQLKDAVSCTFQQFFYSIFNAVNWHLFAETCHVWEMTPFSDHSSRAREEEDSAQGVIWGANSVFRLLK